MADNSATIEQIQAFLDEFKVKARVYGINYDYNKKENRETLAELDLWGSERDKCVLALTPQDYYQGPDVNQYDPTEGAVWMFGIGIKKRGRKKKMPIYIKIYITKTENEANYCISVHIAKFEMFFPYKSEL